MMFQKTSVAQFLVVSDYSCRRWAHHILIKSWINTGGITMTMVTNSSIITIVFVTNTIREDHCHCPCHSLYLIKFIYVPGLFRNGILMACRHNRSSIFGVKKLGSNTVDTGRQHLSPRCSMGRHDCQPENNLQFGIRFGDMHTRIRVVLWRHAIEGAFLNRLGRVVIIHTCTQLTVAQNLCSGYMGWMHVGLII